MHHNVEQTPAFKSYFDIKRADRNLLIMGSVLCIALGIFLVRLAESSDNIVINGNTDAVQKKTAALRYYHVD